MGIVQRIARLVNLPDPPPAVLPHPPLIVSPAPQHMGWSHHAVTLATCHTNEAAARLLAAAPDFLHALYLLRCSPRCRSAARLADALIDRHGSTCFRDWGRIEGGPFRIEVTRPHEGMPRTRPGWSPVDSGTDN